MDELEAIFHEMGFDAKTAQLPEAGVVYALARTFSLTMRELSKVYQRFGLSAPSFNLLMLLQRGRDPDACTQQELGRRLVVSASDMTGLIDRLERKRLVRRVPGRDRRCNLLRITPKGSALLEGVWPNHVEALKRLTAALGRDDARVLLRALARVRQALAG
jgi:DNA-binding MarR family transcriptional regulator